MPHTDIIAVVYTDAHCAVASDDKKQRKRLVRPRSQAQAIQLQVKLLLLPIGYCLYCTSRAGVTREFLYR